MRLMESRGDESFDSRESRESLGDETHEKLGAGAMTDPLLIKPFHIVA